VIPDFWLPPEDRKFLRSAEEAWADPETRRMTLVTLRLTEEKKARDVARALGVSIFTYQDYELGRKPLSREHLEKAAAFMEVPFDWLDLSLRVTDTWLMQVRAKRQRAAVP
jgi:transcriptional regulator with XRE-family HTH domain